MVGEKPSGRFAKLEQEQEAGYSGCQVKEIQKKEGSNVKGSDLSERIY